MNQCFVEEYTNFLKRTDFGADRDYEGQGIGRLLMKTAHDKASGEKDIAIYLIANENAMILRNIIHVTIKPPFGIKFRPVINADFFNDTLSYFRRQGSVSILFRKFHSYFISIPLENNSSFEKVSALSSSEKRCLSSSENCSHNFCVKLGLGISILRSDL